MRNLLIIFTLFFFSCTYGEAQTLATFNPQHDIHITPLNPHIVEVIFKIDSTGKADVLKIKSEQMVYQQLILDRLKNISLGKNDALVGKTLHYRFDFSSLEVES